MIMIDLDRYTDETIILLKEMQEDCKNGGAYDDPKRMKKAEALSVAIRAINIIMRAKNTLLNKMGAFAEINSDYNLCKDCDYNESADEEYSAKLICGKHSKIVDVRDKACENFEERR